MTRLTTKLLVTATMVLGAAIPVFAQAQVFVSGNVFADVKRFSGDTSLSTLDGSAAGAGASVGVIAATHWRVEFEIQPSASTTQRRQIPIGVLALPTIPVTQFQSVTTNRLLGSSVLVGYQAANHRFRPAVVGGLTFMHVRRQLSTTGPIPLVDIPVPVTSALVIRPTELIDNVPAATVGAELAIGLTDHLAAVPEVRAHAFSLDNGPSAFAIRPGIAVRWTF
jgi:hypothetical protein